MAETINRGPYVGLGSLMGNVNTSSGSPVDSVDVYDGPSMLYQGVSFLDPRYFPANKDGLGAGRIPAFLGSQDTFAVNAIPSASTATPQDIAANQATTNGTAMTLVSAQPSAANNGQCAHMPSCPFVPSSGPNAGKIVTVFALDMGFVYGTTTAGSKTVTVVDSNAFYVGQWVVIGGAGNSGATIPLITYVTALPTATTVTIFNAAVAAVTRAPIANANNYMGFPANPVATGASPYVLGGVGRFFNPTEGVARAVGINAAAGAAGGIFTVVGYDIYGNPMSEAITVGAGAAVAYGNKCFKYIASVTPNVTDAVAHYGVGVSDTIGLNLRSTLWEHMITFVNQAMLTAATGFTAALALQSGPSTTTTADVRGSMQVGTRGNNTGVGAAGAAGGPLSGTVRVAIRVGVTPAAMTLATPANSQTVYGVAQV
jgi:hypothetical protein